MQEEIENRTVTLIVSANRMTGNVLKAAISKYMAYRRERRQQESRDAPAPVTPQGKQTVRQLIGQNQGVSNLELTDPSMRQFNRIAKRYGVDYAIKRDRSTHPPKYLIFFKGRDADALTAVFSEYSGRRLRRAERPSVRARLRQFRGLLRNATPDRTRRRERER